MDAAYCTGNNPGRFREAGMFNARVGIGFCVNGPIFQMFGKGLKDQPKFVGDKQFSFFAEPFFVISDHAN